MSLKYLTKQIIALALLSQVAFADGHPYNAERAKALDSYTNEIAKHPEYTPEQKRNVKKQFLDKAVENTKKKLREQARGSGKPLKITDEDSPEASGAPLKGSSKTTGTAATSQSKGSSTQKRVTSTGGEKVESGGAHGISFKGGSNDAITGGTATIGDGEVTPGGAETIQFGGKKK